MAVYVCYQFRERPLAEALAARLGATNHPFDDYDQRVRLQAAGPDADGVKARLAAQIGAAGAFVCIVGPTTATSSWVGWEIAAAALANKRLLVLREDESAALPDALGRTAFEALPDVAGCVDLLGGAT